MPGVTGAHGRPEFATNDPAAGGTVADAVNQMLAFTHPYEAQGRSVAVASAFFNVGGWTLLAPELKRVGRVRLMLGAEPQRQVDPVVLRPGSVPRQRAGKAALADALAEQQAALAVERDLVPFTADARGQVRDLIGWLRGGTVEVRRYTKEFLHGKAYLVDHPALGVIAGSSNFTFAGLSRNRELNLGQYATSTIDAVRDWFDGLWAEAEPFDLAGFYEEQVVPDDPWMVFLRMLWEAYGHQVAEDDEDVAADPSMRDLLAFQKDGVGRARRILERHNGVLVADEVGLGKTYVGGALVKDTVRARQRVLVVAPKIIRDTVWRPYVDREHLAGWVDCISYDDLLAEPTADGKRWKLGVPRTPDEYALVVLDEAHTVRNGDTLRARALLDILKASPLSGASRKRVVLLTATPVNNALGDLHSLLSYFIVHDDEFAEIGIPSLAAHFRALDKMDTDDLSPELLFDVLDAVAVRRTRQFVRQHYVGQRIDKSGATLVFPEPVVRRVDYDLAPVLEGFFDAFAHALGADKDPGDPDLFYSGHIPPEGLASLDPARLTLAGYTPSRYRLRDDADARQRAAEVQVAGLLRTGLLKRFESSSAAFIATCRKMAGTLDGLLALIQTEGLVASGESLRDWVRLDLDDDAAVDGWRANAETDDAAGFDIAALVADIESDTRLLRGFADTVEQGMAGTVDPKLEALTGMLVTIVEDARQDALLRAAGTTTVDPHAAAERERDDRKTLVFSYFADTIHYIQDHIDEILADPRLACYRGRVAFVTGTKRANPTPASQATTATQEEAVAGFAPRTGGPVDPKTGSPLATDQYDLLFTTDVLSQGVNLQQARNVASVDLPFNPQVLVQRHGRLDRIGSVHPRLYVWCFFPDVGLDRWLGLEAILHRKLAKAAASIGHGAVLPGVAASADRVFNAKNEQVKALAQGSAALFTGHDRSLISGEEFRAILRKAISDASLAKHLEAMPWGVGSGFATDDRPPGFVFCARILDRADEPAFRFIPLPAALTPGMPANPAPPADPDDPRPVIRGHHVDIEWDALTALTMSNPPDPATPASLPPEWQDLAYDAWATAAQHIADTWNASLDASSSTEVPAVIRQAVQHLRDHSSHRNRDDADRAEKAYRRGQAARVTAIVRAVMRDQGLTDATRTDRLIELVEELGLTAPDSKPKRYAIDPADVHLIAWLAITPPGEGTPAR